MAKKSKTKEIYRKDVLMSYEVPEGGKRLGERRRSIRKIGPNEEPFKRYASKN